MALRRVWLPSACWSSRAGARVRLIVLHSSEGAQTYADLGAWFKPLSRQASSHVGIDNFAAGVVGEYVHRADKAWTECYFNPVGVSAELCTPQGAWSGWSRADWLAHGVMMENCARWVAEEARAFGIPVVALTPAQAQGGAAGVCEHNDLGPDGCGHSDCGPGFPMDWLIARARQILNPPSPVAEAHMEFPGIPGVWIKADHYIDAKGVLHVVGLGTNGLLYHTSKSPGGAWTSPKVVA